MPITPDTPTVPTPKEISPVPYASVVGMDLSEELKVVGERVTPLKIVEYTVIDDSASEEETTVNLRPETKRPKPMGKRTKMIPSGPPQASPRPSLRRGYKKQRTKEEDEEAPDSPTFPVPRAFLMQELERCEEQIRQFSSQLKQAQEAKSELLILLSSQKVVGGASGTVGEAQVHGEEAQGAAEAQVGGDGDQAAGTK